MTMTKNKKIQRSPLTIAVLALLAEEPMHPYRMQQLIKKRGKDEVINVRQRTSIYQTIERLLRDGLIVVRGTSRETGRPDRTVYEATEEGKALLLEWLRDMLSALPQEFPEFPAALSFLGLLRIQEVEQLLEKRTVALKEELARIDSALQTAKAAIPRLFMLEMEYKRTVIEAELKWVSCLIGDIRSGDLVWDEEWLREIAQRFASPNNEPV
ncbi:helix-turn-helix transcriptional regulator [Paenibacillus sp. GCM10023250]|uniref:helix-turn-helix transcriptional regulator n=1 Tax=Paenibacillus sp. GCM10023250 TaxID=3252648 RepID=UPI003609509A